MYSVARERLTRDFVDTLFLVPLYHALYPDDWDRDMLSQVKAVGQKKNVFVKLRSSTLLVKTWLTRRGICFHGVKYFV